VTLTVALLRGGVDEALALLPSGPGVGQILAEEDRNLVIGRPANLRRWAAGHLGRAKPPKVIPGKLPPRPPTDLTPIAAAIAYARTKSAFGQRLAYERLMARYVPLAKRRDLKRPAYLRIEEGDPLPRVVVQPTAEGADVFGPFRDRRAATRARDALDKHFRMRPCDFGFKPPVDVPDGLAADIARALDDGVDLPEVPPWMRRAGARSLIVEEVKAGCEIYPVIAGAVIDEAFVETPFAAIEDAIARLDWAAAHPAGDDTPWLNAWRHGKHSGVEVRVGDGDSPREIAARVTQALGRGAPAVGGVVG
jgi:hypothetical protein